jgi:hypothetical protein
LSTPEASATAADISSVLVNPLVNLDSIPPKYHDFVDVFSKQKAEKLADHHPYNLKINLEENHEPSFSPIYSLSKLELKTLCKFIDKHLSIGLIHLTHSSHGAPVLFIKKKDGSLHLCVDYQALNCITQKDWYLLPLTSNLLDAPHRACIYTKINLCTAYHLVHILEGDKWKTAFCTRYGSYEWIVILEGLTNAPATFQHFMNNIFSDMLNVSVCKGDPKLRNSLRLARGNPKFIR